MSRAEKEKLLQRIEASNGGLPDVTEVEIGSVKVPLTLKNIRKRLLKLKSSDTGLCKTAYVPFFWTSPCAFVMSFG